MARILLAPPSTAPAKFSRRDTMLYDPKWKKANTETPSLKGLIAWLKNQPAHQTYDWDCYGACVVGRYLAAMVGNPGNNAEHLAVFGGRWSPIFGVSDDSRGALCAYQAVGYGTDTLGRAQTMGAALRRARKVLKHGA